MKNPLLQSIRVVLVFAFFFLTIEPVFSLTGPEGEVTGNNNQSSTYVTGLTSGRAKSLVGGVIGLVSLIISLRARSRASGQSGSRKSLSKIAVVLGLVAIILSVVHLALNTGGFGTGGGKAGAIVALVLGLAGTGIRATILWNTRE